MRIVVLLTTSDVREVDILGHRDYVDAAASCTDITIMCS